MGRFRSWVDIPFVLDHASVIAQFNLQPFPMAFPFKFNPTWLKEEDFASIVKVIWKDPDFLTESDVQHRFVWKLKVLKARIKSWAKQKRVDQ
jgi:hypothetical protein